MSVGYKGLISIRLINYKWVINVDIFWKLVNIIALSFLMCYLSYFLLMLYRQVVHEVMQSVRYRLCVLICLFCGM
jgi:hypothetical protein